jgi:cell division protease FtsH
MKKMQYVLIALLISDALSLDAGYGNMNIRVNTDAVTQALLTVAAITAASFFANLGIKAYDYLSNYFLPTRSTIGDAVIPEVRFSDIIGAQEAKEELQTIIAFFKEPKKLLDQGIQMPKGILLVGPPGNGKTLLAKALAGEAGVKFFAIDGASFNATHWGQGTARVNALFEKAHKEAPCIIFIDEIDGIGKRDPEPRGGVHEHNTTITGLLTKIDGFQTNAQRPVFIVAATNHRELVDDALIRPGRIDVTVVVENPNKKDRKEMLELYANKTKTKEIITNIDFEKLATESEGFSGADIAILVNRAKISAVRARPPRESPTQEDFDNVLQQIKKSKEKSPVKLSLTPKYKQLSDTISSTIRGLIENNQEPVIKPAPAGILSKLKKPLSTYFSTKD